MTEDEARVPMTGEEKTAWVYGLVVILTSGAYFAYIATQLVGTSPEAIRWEIPMLIAIGASIVGVMVLTIVSAIGGAVWSGIRGRFQEPDFTTDERDRDIKRLAERRNYAVISIGLFGTLVLAMLDADTFWIGNWVFLTGSVGALLEVSTKVRAYRRGF
jgi:hypothetical protein